MATAIDEPAPGRPRRAAPPDARGPGHRPRREHARKRRITATPGTGPAPRARHADLGRPGAHRGRRRPLRPGIRRGTSTAAVREQTRPASKAGVRRVGNQFPIAPKGAHSRVHWIWPVASAPFDRPAVHRRHDRMSTRTKTVNNHRRKTGMSGFDINQLTISGNLTREPELRNPKAARRSAACGSLTTSASRTPPASGPTARSTSTSPSGRALASGSPRTSARARRSSSPAGCAGASGTPRRRGKRQAVDITADSVVPVKRAATSSPAADEAPATQEAAAANAHRRPAPQRAGRRAERGHGHHGDDTRTLHTARARPPQARETARRAALPARAV